MVPEHTMTSGVRMQTLQSGYRPPLAPGCWAFPPGTWRSPQICLDPPSPTIGVPEAAPQVCGFYRVQCDRRGGERARLSGTCWASLAGEMGCPAVLHPPSRPGPWFTQSGRPRHLSSGWRGAGAGRVSPSPRAPPSRLQRMRFHCPAGLARGSGEAACSGCERGLGGLTSIPSCPLYCCELPQFPRLQSRGDRPVSCSSFLGLL